MSEYLPCLKRQHEIYKGEERHRCLERTSEYHRQHVTPEICESCPVRKFIEKPQPTNPEPDFTYQLPVINNPGGEYPECIYRTCGTECKCDATGLPVNPEICHRCDEDVRDKTAGAVDKLTNYYAAIKKWIASGRKTRSDERVSEIFNEHCKNCEKYDSEKHACMVCGCGIGESSAPLGNKLKMSTEACPLGRFGADA